MHPTRPQEQLPGHVAEGLCVGGAAWPSLGATDTAHFGGRRGSPALVFTHREACEIE